MATMGPCRTTIIIKKKMFFNYYLFNIMRSLQKHLTSHSKKKKKKKIDVTQHIQAIKILIRFYILGEINTHRL